MPRQRPATSGYAQLSQADEDDRDLHDPTDGHYDDDLSAAPRTISTSAPQYAPIQPPRPHMHMPSDGSSSVGYQYGRRGAGAGRPRRRGRSNSSGVDIKAINARLERWAEEIASKFKLGRVKGKSRAEERLEIHHSVFQPPEGVRPVTAEQLHAEAEAEEEAERRRGGPEGGGPVDGQRMTPAQFERVVESVRTAIELGVHPTLITQGSSGSYFARNADGRVVGVFKPKDEEPYASRNPKWTKWLHRNLFPCFFGRACLIPNLSYVSEAAAYVLDRALRTHLVPYTDIVHLASRSFYYDFWQRSAFYRKRKPLPYKPGSFQVFLKGFKDATAFLREHPWPDPRGAGFDPDDAPKSRKARGSVADCLPGLGGRASDETEAEAEAGAEAGLRPEARSSSASRPSSAAAGRFEWTPAIQQAFREELEKLVILDYIMRNTDRGLDNWMIRIDPATEEVSIVAEAPKLGGGGDGGADLLEEQDPAPRPISESELQDPYRRQGGMDVNRSASKTAGVSIGAIDNSLSWPWKHPDAWRSFPFGWLFLPVSLIGQPFSARTRAHFLPLLTSTDWWTDTQVALRRVFEQDADFKERMFARQVAVMKGQAWNVVETLKAPQHGPLELARRARVCVWDDVVDVPVAIPLRSPSAELRRQLQHPHLPLPHQHYQQAPLASSAAAPFAVGGADDTEDEMDIGTAADAAPAGPAASAVPPSADLAAPPSRFEVSRNPSGTDLAAGRTLYDAPGSPATVAGAPLGHATAEFFSNGAAAAGPGRPDARRAATATKAAAAPRRRQSFSRRHGGGRHRHTASAALLYDDAEAEAEGDLGYAAAAGTEKNTRKVIVERVEQIKSAPVFTWC